MRRWPIVILLLAVLAGTAAAVHAAPAAKEAPTLSISAVFDENARATYYTANFKTPSAGGAPTYAWHLQPPPDDPGCRQFAPMPNRAVESVWYHDKTDGCAHLSTMHNGTVNLQVTVVLNNDKRPWVCNAAYVGTLSGGPEEGLCTIEASATHAVVRPPINDKDRYKILADLFDEYTESFGAMTFVLTVAAVPSGPITGVPALITGAAAVGSTVLARIAKRKAEDPPDRNFLALPVARAGGVPQFQPSASMPYLVSYAFDALSDNINATEGYTNAFVTAINRASGAHAAGNATAQRAQEISALADAEAIATLDDQRPTLRSNLVTALLQSGIRSTPISAAKLRAARGKALPAKVTSALRQAKFTASDLAAARAALKAPAKLGAESFPAVLTVPSASDRRDAAAMRAYIAFARKALG